LPSFLQGRLITDKAAEDKAMSPAERLVWHKAQSLPIMEGIRDWGVNHLESKTVQDNSALGKAIRYLDKHYEGLTGFCQIEGAALDNNLMEATLKLVARNRKNSGFFKTGNGAAIAELITSLIATSVEAGANPVDYFNVLQRNAADVKANPQNYFPKNYQQNN
jgi:transposase